MPPEISDDFRKWLDTKGYTFPEKLEPQIIRFLRASYEQELKNPEQITMPNANLNQIES